MANWAPPVKPSPSGRGWGEGESYCAAPPPAATATAAPNTVIPAQAGIQNPGAPGVATGQGWIPAFAGMTAGGMTVGVRE